MNSPPSAESRGLYQKRIPIHTRSVRGSFRSFKNAVLATAFLVFFGLPWLSWNRLEGPAQALAFDLVGRRFFVFDMVIYPQDVFALSLLLFIAAALLFFVTTLVGRAWCGYFCFQTLWSDLFVMIEHLFQGERPARLRLHQQTWNLEKLLKLGATHTLWLLVSWWTAVTFMLYFGYAPELLARYFAGTLDAAGYVTVGVLTFSTYVAAGLVREQVCTYICPYGRFQGVMVEPETLVVTYEYRRGEGSAGRAPSAAGQKTREERAAKGLGDCIDCGFCVQVCPAGIDIRDGLQYRCISCGLCIDACNNIMDTMGFQRGLIRYDNQFNADAGSPTPPKLYWKRLKTLGYGLALMLMSGLLVYVLASRSEFEESVQQVRQPLFVVLSTGEIRNRYQVRITNKTDREQSYVIRVQGLPEQAMDMGDLRSIVVRPGKSLVIPVSVRLKPEVAARINAFDVVIAPVGEPGKSAVRRVRFHTREE